MFLRPAWMFVARRAFLTSWAKSSQTASEGQERMLGTRLIAEAGRAGLCTYEKGLLQQALELALEFAVGLQMLLSSAVGVGDRRLSDPEMFRNLAQTKSAFPP